MKHTVRKLAAVLTTLCMLFALCPAALAAVPTATAYIRDTDGVDSGAVYAIYTNEDDGGNQNRILYHTGSGKTDKVTASVSGDELALNGGFAASRQLWTITAVEGGYTVRSVDSGRYLDLSQSSISNLNTSAEAVVLTIDFDEEAGLYTIASGDSYLSFNSTENTAFLTGSTGYALRLFKQTEVPAETADREDLIPQPGTTQDEPFAPGTGGSNNFRIPSIITLDSGRILAAIDARWNHLGDACALDTIVSYSDDGGKTWNYSFANYFEDSVDSKQSYATAFIDPVMVQGNDGTIYLMVDLFPGGVALNTAPMAPTKSSGYVEIDGVQRLVLYTSGTASQQNDSNYVSYVGDFEDGYAKIYDVDGSVTDYYVDEYYYLYQGDGSDPDAQKIYCQQLGSSKYIQQNLFFYNADLHVRCATYLWLLTSIDEGETWSAPTILNPQIRTGEDQFYGVGPGAGLCLEDGTIMLPAYTFTSGIANSNQIASFIYSTNGGKTWTRSDDATGSDHWSSESCLVQIDETTVRHFYRDGYSTLYYTDHTWDGEKWVAGDPVDTGVHKTYNNQLSAIKYSQQLDGKDVILLSTAAGNANSRTNGKIYTFVVNEDKTLTLVNTYEVTASGVSYGYSSLTEMADGSIALLYEGASSRSVFEVIPASDLGFQADSVASLTGPATVGQNVRVPYTVSIGGDMSKIDNVKLSITVSGLCTGWDLQALNGFTKLEEKETHNEDGSVTHEIILAYGLSDVQTLSDTIDALQVFVRSSADQKGDITVKLSDVTFGNTSEIIPVEIENATVTTQVVDIFDLNNDGKVDQIDLAIAQSFYQAKEGDGNWTEAQKADLNSDGIVDLEDLVLLATVILNA